MRIIAIFFILSLASNALAQNILFDQLLGHIKTHGQPSEFNGYIFLGIERVDPESQDDVEHTADYFNLVHTPDGMGGLVPRYVSLVSEDWQINAGNEWVIRQWIFKLDLQGNISSYRNSELVETMDRRVLDVRVLPATDNQAKQALKTLLTDWADWTGVR